MPDLPFNEFETADKSDFTAPLAERLRPRLIEDLVGQNHILGTDKPLRRMIERDLLCSMVFYGPPGTGKSTLASIIAGRTKSSYIRINAVLSNIKELREAVRAGEMNLKQGRKTILFIDEIHRFNKSQQDALLPSVEAGAVILIGSTTHNPYFYLNNALLSRVSLFQFKGVEDSEIKRCLKRAIAEENIAGCSGKIVISDNAVNMIIKASSGDIRRALSFLEFAFLSGINKGSDFCISDEIVTEIVCRKNLKYDNDEHYDIISAFIKSVRGSDPDAAVYYMALMLESGEDPRFIARRLAVLAAEDIGLAEPDALSVVASTITVVDFIGMPEAQIVLSECTIYLSLCPKSNSAVNAVFRARKEISGGLIMSVPGHLRNRGPEKEEAPEYKYAHDYPYHVVKQNYLEKPRTYYEPGNLGAEKKLKERLEWIKKNIYNEKTADRE